MRNAETVTFGGSGLDRSAAQRRDEGSLRADPAARVTPLWRGKPLIQDDPDSGALSLAHLPTDHAALRDSGQWVFLGVEGDTPRFAADISAWEPAEMPDTLGAFHDPSRQAHPDFAPAEFAELRATMLQLTARDAELAATARGILEWHRLHRFCANCGHATDSAQCGWQRTCPSCERHHFPRTDPVVIMLVTRGNSVLLGRSPGWPDGMYSLLAGFVEPGETIEAAVRRETWEETGIRVGQVDYLASQPWPFPASLMIGCRAEAVSSDIRVDPEEIEDALWLSREDAMQAMAGKHRILPARKGAIAHFLLTRWLADTLD
ncbi:NADH pyrophosphatase [Rhodobacteraceae bacterium THAF1]|uniref:NAD(+) diphosphatase n=1 Tax=Palleronia sp. THAF1 TaxID=2587842 RepID=UPI000F3AF656|nr:NAD(+) diphosphatase [Palleronia sp. THAF1]QFU09712.1 NADH pyrophosphatase [Palleronia sp. THAF1]VDC17385.1 NADH pyrophosphatase [Rhodobacteraceae bacterium THAF1]